MLPGVLLNVTDTWCNNVNALQQQNNKTDLIFFAKDNQANCVSSFVLFVFFYHVWGFLLSIHLE